MNNYWFKKVEGDRLGFIGVIIAITLRILNLIVKISYPYYC